MKRSLLWPGIVFGLIGLNMCVVFVTIVLANSDPSAYVEPEYDRKALRWDHQARQQATNRRLGWHASIELLPAGSGRALTVTLIDGLGAPVAGGQVRVEAFRSARPRDRARLELLERAPGAYEGLIADSPPGIWEFRVQAARAGDVFTAAFEREVPR